MTDIPNDAKMQMLLATKYGNAEARYENDNGEDVKYHMDNSPVRETLGKYSQGILNRVIEIRNLIFRADKKTRAAKKSSLENKKLLDSNKDN
ncbi:DUF4747 family protein [Xenorhabdus bovienii]|nr:hypothetical protein [Xenorhabdus bovienii]MDE9475383.1 DUF4747 family protein [Xenorhabdus bovienii]